MQFLFCQTFILEYTEEVTFCTDSIMDFLMKFNEMLTNTCHNIILG